MESFNNWIARILGTPFYKPTAKSITKMNKLELQSLGREHGIELDRRFKRKTLVKQLRIKLGV